MKNNVEEKKSTTAAYYYLSHKTYVWEKCFSIFPSQK